MASRYKQTPKTSSGEWGGLHGTHLVSISRGCIEIPKPSNSVSVGYGDGNMKCRISKTYMNYFDVPMIGHAAHVDPDKEQHISL